VNFAGRIVRGDFGVSYVSRLPAWPSAFKAFGMSVTLVLVTMIMAVGLGCLCGVAAASGHNRFGRVARAICILGSSFPPHVLGPTCVLFFGVWLGALPTGGWDGWRSAVLPVFVLMIGPLATIGEVVRAEMVEALRASFIRTARAKGLSNRRVLAHALAVSRHGAIALSGVMLTGLLSGAVLVETLFSLPGIGRMLVDGVRNSDVPVIQASLTLAIGFAMIVSTLMDAGSRYADPRLR
jgi:peptide/nickel transport system permease protein